MSRLLKEVLELKTNPGASFDWDAFAGNSSPALGFTKRGLPNYQYYSGVPCHKYNDSICGSLFQFHEAPILIMKAPILCEGGRT